MSNGWYYVFYLCFPKSRIIKFLITWMEQHPIITPSPIKLCVHVILLSIVILNNKTFFGWLINWWINNHKVTSIESFKRFKKWNLHWLFCFSQNISFHFFIHIILKLRVSVPILFCWYSKIHVACTAIFRRKNYVCVYMCLKYVQCRVGQLHYLLDYISSHVNHRCC